MPFSSGKKQFNVLTHTCIYKTVCCRDGAQVHIPAGTLYDSTETFSIDKVGTFDGYGNRNSTNYVDIYKIPEAKTLIRGTFRYDGKP